MLHKQELTKMLKDIDTNIESVSKQIREVPKGKLGVEKRRGIPTYVLAVTENGVRNRRSLAKNPELVSAMLKNELLQKELSVLQKNRAAVAAALKRYKIYNKAFELHKLQNKWPVPDQLLSSLLGNSLEDEWSSAPFEQLDYMPENKKHITSRGLRVRSKSEMLIAEKLYDYGIPFRYEAVIETADFRLAPDFTVMRADGKLFYIEHMGLTAVRSYLDRQLIKIRQYASIGIVPWYNLIITYDDESGSVDLRSVEFAINNRLLI